jgi:hypothetical protein
MSGRAELEFGTLALWFMTGQQVQKVKASFQKLTHPRPLSPVG